MVIQGLFLTTNMFKIPSNNRFNQTNESDLFGNIEYTKNINFDELGYLKLSPRCISLLNSEDDTNFNLPISLGRVSFGDVYIATAENPYILDISDSNCSLIEDTDNGDDSPPNLTFDSHGKWWISRWHVTTDTALFYKTVSNGDWTDTSVSLTTGKTHPIELFEKANTLMVGNGNSVKQLDTSYSTGSLAQLTISSDYEITHLAYNNNYIAIGTKLSDTVDGQNKDASLFIWDGSASSANEAHKVGSDMVVGLAPYKSSFVILTRKGELKYFNGGGFDVIASFPVYFKNLIWGDFINRQAYGDTIIVEGDRIYINIKSQILDDNLKNYCEQMPGGIWCYDPKIGLYHRYSGSISQGTFLYVQSSGVNTTTNTATVYSISSYPTSPTIPETGNPVKVLTTTIGGLTQGEIYYLIKASSTEFKIASTKENALALIPIDLTSTGSNSLFLAIDEKDFGQSLTGRSGGMGFFGHKTFAYENILFGGDYIEEGGSQYSFLNMSVSKFKNIGYIITSKLNSSEIEDNILKGYIKYRPLKSTDIIEIKYKNKDYINIPVVASCTATSSTVLTTTDNIADAYAFSDDLECEIIMGAGSGQMVKVSSITYNTGTYTITLESALDGVSASDLLDIKLDNWTSIITIDTDSSPDNWQEFSIAKNSKWIKFKVVLNGSDITIEELQILNKTQIKSV